MKAMKKLIPAICMLLVTAVLMGTSTYAWFSMNTQVTATGMQVKAKAEGGIVITNSAATTWAASASAAYTDAVALYPTSSSNMSNWFHAKSENADDAAAGQTSDKYDSLSIALSDTSNFEGVGYVNKDGADGYNATGDEAYYLLSNFKIKSSGDTMTKTLRINNVTVTSSSALLPIDVALRVAVVVEDVTYIYAPVTSVTVAADPDHITLVPTFTYKVGGSASATTTYNPTATTNGGSESGAYLAGKNKTTTVTSISNITAINVKIYVYFEGEDAQCKSTNVSGVTVDTLTVSVMFGTTDIA